MTDFNLTIPTKIFFGKSKENEIGEILQSYNFKNVLIVIGQGSVKKSGLLQRIIEKIDEKLIKHVLLEGVRANPTVELVKEGIKLAKENVIDCILAIGGGSVIDTAKLISTGFYYDGDPFDISTHKAEAKKALPLGVVLTLAAAGSEMSNSCVIQNDELNIKSGYNSDFNRPLFAIENPELTYSVNKEQTGYGIVDIMMHSLERYFSYSTDDEIADEFAMTVINNTKKSGVICLNEPDNYEARGNMMLLSSLSHNGLTGIGKNVSMPVHQLEHALSGLYPHVAHGGGLAVLFPCWLDKYWRFEIKKTANCGRILFNMNGSDEEIAPQVPDKFRDFYKSIGMPTTYNDLKINNVDIDKLVSLVSNGGTRVIKNKYQDLDAKLMREIYELGVK